MIAFGFALGEISGTEQTVVSVLNCPFSHSNHMPKQSIPGVSIYIVEVIACPIKVIKDACQYPIYPQYPSVQVSGTTNNVLDPARPDNQVQLGFLCVFPAERTSKV